MNEGRQNMTKLNKNKNRIVQITLKYNVKWDWENLMCVELLFSGN